MERVYIRWLIRRDITKILQFDKNFTEEEILHHLRQRNCIGMIAEHGENVLGYMIYELQKYNLDLLRFVIHPDYYRRGIGKIMIDKMKSKLTSHRRISITSEIHEKNLDGQLFLRSQGFKALKVLRNFYADSQEDAYFMQYNIPKELITKEHCTSYSDEI